jgi:hypothetical protein
MCLLCSLPRSGVTINEPKPSRVRGLIAAGIVRVAGCRLLGALFAEGLDPDLVVFSEDLHDGFALPRATAFAAKDGRFAVVEGTDEVKVPSRPNLLAIGGQLNQLLWAFDGGLRAVVAESVLAQH